ncbi:hypothetical protein CLU96_3304 [Chryseobacterium sp. 52]|uniref:hypothetical protein n=1 Tax=Chryseobacterium sp. 52 TaxID=2035213 RepID=UPI000C5693FD|nr:hypothetical protein [Chryseobacterium sp. 52]PIF46279.1 hypothetical protein CLU96_3304 [Chryseobacterium sp. 52]
MPNTQMIISTSTLFHFMRRVLGYLLLFCLSPSVPAQIGIDKNTGSYFPEESLISSAENETKIYVSNGAVITDNAELKRYKIIPLSPQKFYTHKKQHTNRIPAKKTNKRSKSLAKGIKLPKKSFFLLATSKSDISFRALHFSNDNGIQTDQFQLKQITILCKNNWDLQNSNLSSSRHSNYFYPGNISPHYKTLLPARAPPFLS